MKFGLYEDYGTYTCAGYPGVIDNLELDAKTFADWGVDYVKLDACYSESDGRIEGKPFNIGTFNNVKNKRLVF